jgi:hypothetical protein
VSASSATLCQMAAGCLKPPNHAMPSHNSRRHPCSDMFQAQGSRDVVAMVPGPFPLPLPLTCSIFGAARLHVYFGRQLQ